MIDEYWSPRYAHYARVNGRTCDEQHAHDSKQSPGGCMVPYIGWIGHHVLKSGCERLPNGEITPEGHNQLDRYLAALTEKGNTQ